MFKRDTTLLLAAAGLRSTASLGLALFLTRSMPASSYGQFRGAQIVTTLAVVFLAAGLPQSLLYLHPTSDPEGRRRLAGATFVQILVLGGLLSAGLALFAGPISSRIAAFEGPAFLRIGAVLLAGQALSLSAPTLAVARGEIWRSAVMEVGLGVVPSLAAIAPALAGAAAPTTLLSFGVAHLVLGAAYWIWLLPAWSGRLVDRALLARQWALAGPQALSSLFGSFAQQADKFLVAALFRAEQLAIYACGAIEVPLVTLFPYVITKTIAPRLARRYGAGDTEGFLRLWHHAIRLTCLVLVPCSLLLWILAETLIAILFPPEYAEAVRPFRVFVLLVPLRLTAYGLVLQATGTTRAILAGAVSGLSANLLLAAVAIPHLGPTGAAWAAVGGQLLSIAVHLFALSRRLAVRFANLLPFSDLAALGGAGVAAGATGLAVLRFLGPTSGKIACVVVVAGVFYALAFAMGRLSAGDLSFALARPSAREPLGYPAK